LKFVKLDFDALYRANSATDSLKWAYFRKAYDLSYLFTSITFGRQVSNKQVMEHFWSLLFLPTFPYGANNRF